MIERFVFREMFEFGEVLRAQRFGDAVFAAKPFSKINEGAPMRAERAIFRSEPIADLFAGGTFDLFGNGHLQIR